MKLEAKTKIYLKTTNLFSSFISKHYMLKKDQNITYLVLTFKDLLTA